MGVTLAITQGPAQPAGGDDQPPDKNIPLTKTCQDGSPPMIGAQLEAKTNVEDPKDSIFILVRSPHSSLVPATSATLLLPSSPQVQVVDLGDGGSSDSESTKSEEATKKNGDIEKGQESSQLVSQAQKNPFSLTTKIITLVKRKMFSIDSLGMTSKVIGTDF